MKVGLFLKHFLFTLGLMVFVFGAQSSNAQEDERQTTTINFDDELIDGEVRQPELLYLLQRRQFNFKRLIKLRENFLPEMNRTSEDIPRGRGPN